MHEINKNKITMSINKVYKIQKFTNRFIKLFKLDTTAIVKTPEHSIAEWLIKNQIKDLLLVTLKTNHKKIKLLQTKNLKQLPASINIIIIYCFFYWNQLNNNINNIFKFNKKGIKNKTSSINIKKHKTQQSIKKTFKLKNKNLKFQKRIIYNKPLLPYMLEFNKHISNPLVDNIKKKKQFNLFVYYYSALNFKNKKSKLKTFSSVKSIFTYNQIMLNQLIKN